MLDLIQKYQVSEDKSYPYTLVIPTWNNLPYLQNCLHSVMQHSTYQGQIIIVINEGSDGTLEWLQTQAFPNVDYLHAIKNIGICYGLNMCRSMIRSDYFVYMNDDMYVLPDWDKVLFERIKTLGTKAFMLSATMIEPYETGNNCVVVQDFGDNLDNFQEQNLLAAQSKLERKDWQGSMWPPNIVHIDTWDMVGGYSTEFSPGMYSDPDFVLKLMNAGVEIFEGLGKSLVYHFGKKSTKRVKQNTGRQMFIYKWGISARVLKNKYLQLGNTTISKVNAPTAKVLNSLKTKLKRALEALK